MSDAQRIRVRRLAGLGLILVLVHLVMVFRFQSTSQLGITVICWYAAAQLALRRWKVDTGEGQLAAQVLGFLLIAAACSCVFWVSDRHEQFIFVYPLVGGLGLGLISGGFRGLLLHKRELAILFCLGIPRGFMMNWVDLSSVTAKVAALLLYYLGQDVHLTGTTLATGSGSVHVDKGCDGTGVIAYLICLAVVFVCLFPVPRSRRWWAIAWAVALAFTTNTLRVVVLTVVETRGHHAAFEYWHQGQGSLLWTVLPVVLFAASANRLMSPTRSPEAGDPRHKISQTTSDVT